MKRYSISQTCTGYYEEKNSKFYAYLAPCADQTACETFIRHIRSLHPEAGHHCYAYQIYKTGEQPVCAYSDDGEPSGTAGKPIFQPLLHGHLFNVCLVVSRKYGGTQLGTGGLARAYAKAAASALKQADVLEIEERIKTELHGEFHNEASIRHVCSAAGAHVTHAEYLTDKVILQLEVKQEKHRDLLSQLHKQNLLKTVGPET